MSPQPPGKSPQPAVKSPQRSEKSPKPAPKARQSSGVGAGPRPRWQAWLHHHRTAAADSLQKLLSQPLSTLLTGLVLGLALALPATLLLLVENVSSLAEELQRPPQLSVLLDSDTDLATAQKLALGIEQRTDIRSVTVVTREQALAQFAEDTGLSDVIDTLPDNPLPHTLLVRPQGAPEAVAYAALADALQRIDGVDSVVLDTAWLDRLAAVIRLARQGVSALGLMMILGAVLMLANTIRLAIEARRPEIVVVKLIGASDAFTRRPFLYTGLWTGICGGVIAVVVIGLLLFLLTPSIDTLLALYDDQRVFDPPPLVDFLSLILVGGALGLASGWGAAHRHLRGIQPG